MADYVDASKKKKNLKKPSDIVICIEDLLFISVIANKL